jgi:hypothetical protein
MEALMVTVIPRMIQEHIQAAEYRPLAEAAGDSTIKEDFFDWAAICEEVANNIDDRRASG